MTDLVERRAEPSADSEPGPDADPDPVSDSKSDAEPVVTEIRDRVERVRRRELDDAIGRLEARGEVTPEQRRIVAALSVGIADALAESWTAALGGDAADVADATDPETVRDLLVE